MLFYTYIDIMIFYLPVFSIITSCYAKLEFFSPYFV